MYIEEYNEDYEAIMIPEDDYLFGFSTRGWILMAFYLLGFITALITAFIPSMVGILLTVSGTFYYRYKIARP